MKDNSVTLYQVRARLHSAEEEQRYLESVDANFKSERAKEILKRESNLFKIVYLNKIGIKTATLQELDLIAEIEPDFLRGHYEDANAVVLRSAG